MTTIDEHDTTRVTRKPREKTWPTLFHPAQLAFPWGGAKRLPKRALVTVQRKEQRNAARRAWRAQRKLRPE